MQQYFVDKKRIIESVARIDGSDAKHIAKVMKMQIGDNVLICDEEKKYTGSIIEISPLEVFVKIENEIEFNSELPANIIIAHGLPKGDKFELVVQKGTELGAGQFVALGMERSIAKWTQEKVDKKIERISKIAKEAAEQSKRMKIPKVSYTSKITELCSEFSHCKYKYVAFEGNANDKPLEQLKNDMSNINTSDDIILVVGPEGGISDIELKYLIENGFTSVSLGRRILRSETAPLYFLSVIGYLLENK